MDEIETQEPKDLSEQELREGSGPDSEEEEGETTEEEVLLEPELDFNVFLIHGLTANPAELKPLHDRLVRHGCFCYSTTLRGHDRSIFDVAKVRSNQWLEDVERQLEELHDRSDKPIVLIGVSFGAILSLWLSGLFEQKFDKGRLCGLVLLSPPLRYRLGLRRFVLKVLSVLPEFLLDKMPLVAKRKRPEAVYRLPRTAFKHHSVGAAARLFKIRRKANKNWAKLEAPVLLMTDPKDHHLSRAVPKQVEKLYSGSSLKKLSFEGGQHALVVGARGEEVVDEIVSFLSEL